MSNRLLYVGTALLMIGLASCQKEEAFVLVDTYHLDNLLVAQGSGFNDELYTFTVELAEEGVSGSAGNYTGTGKVVRYQFYGSKYYLESSVYPAVQAGSESDASYVASQSVVYDVVNGSATPKGIESGYVYVSRDNGSYRFGTTSRLSDGTEFKFVSGCAIDFPKLPKYKYVPNLVQFSEAADRTVLEVAGSGISMEGGVVNGTGILIHLEFPFKGELKDGVYNNGDYLPGFLNDRYAAWGAVWDEGSRIYDYANGAGAVSMYLTTQTISVTSIDGGKKRVEVDCDDVIYIFEGNI